MSQAYFLMSGRSGLDNAPSIMGKIKPCWMEASRRVAKSGTEPVELKANPASICARGGHSGLHQQA
jgi:hypothetical protein